MKIQTAIANLDNKKEASIFCLVEDGMLFHLIGETFINKNGVELFRPEINPYHAVKKAIKEGYDVFYRDHQLYKTVPIEIPKMPRPGDLFIYGSYCLLVAEVDDESYRLIQITPSNKQKGKSIAGEYIPEMKSIEGFKYHIKSIFKNENEVVRHVKADEYALEMLRNE